MERRRDKQTDKVKPVYTPFNWIESQNFQKAWLLSIDEYKKLLNLLTKFHICAHPYTDVMVLCNTDLTLEAMIF